MPPPKKLMLKFILTIFFLLIPQNQSVPPGVGDDAPDFTLPMATSDTIDFQGITLSEIIGPELVVLAFYPADWSGGCTKEMCTFRDQFKEFDQLGCRVLGISGDYVFSHREWARHHDLPFPLLSDHQHVAAKAYGSFDSTTGYNKRTVFLIGKDGTIVYRDMKFSMRDQHSFDKLKEAIRRVGS